MIVGSWEKFWIFKCLGFDVVIDYVGDGVFVWFVNFYVGFELLSFDVVYVLFVCFKEEGVVMEMDVFNNGCGLCFFCCVLGGVMFELNMCVDVVLEYQGIFDD